MANFLQNGIIQYVSYSTEFGAVVGSLIFTILCMAIGYLLGSINSAVIISNVFYGSDIRKSGSGNAGTTNMLRVYGKKAALFTLLGDILKSLMAVFLAGIIGGFHYEHAYSTSTLCYIAGFFCIMGHIFPVYHRFKGGKGVLCTAAIVAALSIKVFALLILIFILLVAITKYVSLGSCTVALIYPFVLARFIAMRGGAVNAVILILTIAEALIIVWCHRKNIDRLRKGQESKISFKRKDKSESERQN